MLFGRLVQVDSLGRHITFHSQLPNEKGSGKSSANIKKEQTKDKQNMEATYLMGKMEVFF